MTRDLPKSMRLGASQDSSANLLASPSASNNQVKKGDSGGDNDLAQRRYASVLNGYEGGVLGLLRIPVRPQEVLRIQCVLVGPPTGDSSRDSKSAIIMVVWLDGDQNVLNGKHRGLSSSDKYGNFVYVPWSAENNTATQSIEIAAPAKARFLMLAARQFSNPNLSLSALLFRRQGHGQS